MEGGISQKNKKNNKRLTGCQEHTSGNTPILGVAKDSCILTPKETWEQEIFDHEMQGSLVEKRSSKNQRGESSQDEEINEYFNYQREGHKNLKPHALLPGSLHSSQLAVFWCN